MYTYLIRHYHIREASNSKKHYSTEYSNNAQSNSRGNKEGLELEEVCHKITKTHVCSDSRVDVHMRGCIAHCKVACVSKANPR